MLAPDLHFMVHSSEIMDDEGFCHRGSKIVQLARGQPEPPTWRSRDFGFAAYSAATAGGLREVKLGRVGIWAFAAPREHCEEIVVFRRGTDTRKKWDEDKLHESISGSDLFFIMRVRQLTSDTPLSKQFNGEWGFWESFYVPLLNEQQSIQALSLMDPSMAEDYFAPSRLPVVCHTLWSDDQAILTIPDNSVVEFECRVAVKEMEEWTDIVNKIGDDMKMTGTSVIEHKHFNEGDEVIEAYHETQGIQEQCRLVKRDLELLQIPIVLNFMCTLDASKWDPDMISLQYKYDAVNMVYTQNLMGGFGSMGGPRADPWQCMPRLCLNALNKVVTRYPEIRTIMDCGCGDMSWMQYFLKENPMITYLGVDMNPYVLAKNFRLWPTMQFVQTDVSNLSGIEVLPQGMDLVICKDFFNHMVLPDAVNAMKRIIGTKPRFLLTNIHSAADNTGWEKRIDKHLHFTRYDFNKPPFSLPYPTTNMQQISDEAYFVLYEITAEGVQSTPERIERMSLPTVFDPSAYSTVADGEWGEAAPAEPEAKFEPPPRAPEEKKPATEKTTLTSLVTELPDRVIEEKKLAERKPIKGMPPVEFRSRCDVIFERYDKDKDGVLNFEELASVMEAGGRKLENYESYVGMCKRIGCDDKAGLTVKDAYKFFEKAPQVLWEEVSRSVDPLAAMVRKGAETLPQTFLEKPLDMFRFEDEDLFAKLQIEVNVHLFYGAQEAITNDHIQAYFAKNRLELHVVAPEKFGSKDIYLWKLVIMPLAAEIVPEDCSLELLDTEGRFGSKKITVKMMKAKPKKKWYKVGQAVSGEVKYASGCSG